MTNLPDIKNYLDFEIVSTFAEMHQPRSNFQLENFVMKQHATPQMQYYQLITEIQALYYTIKEVSLKLKKHEIEIERFKSSGDEIDLIEAELLELGIEQTKVLGVGAFRELEFLLKLKSNFPDYTRDDIEQNQPEYWDIRLHQQQEVSPNQQVINQTRMQSFHSAIKSNQNNKILN